MRIYNRALSTGEIQALHNGLPTDASTVDLSSGLVAHYPLDETTGTVIRDRSGNGYDGTLYGKEAQEPKQNLLTWSEDMTQWAASSVNINNDLVSPN